MNTTMLVPARTKLEIPVGGAGGRDLQHPAAPSPGRTCSTTRRPSAVDLLVIKSGDYHPDRLTEAIYENLHGAGAAVDVIVVTPEEVERYRDAFSLVIYPALRE